MGAVHPSTTLRHRFYLAAAAFAILLIGGAVDAFREAGKETKRALESGWAAEELLSRRRLGAPGSSPPSCRSKCGQCTPCKAVHVPIHPGQSMPLEYYPEAWRCKCGDKLFMP